MIYFFYCHWLFIYMIIIKYYKSIMTKKEYKSFKTREKILIVNMTGLIFKNKFK